MIRLALRELISRRTATALTALGLITASLGFVILSGTSQTTTAVLRGDVGQAWNTPYDVLVRPPATATPLERQQGLIRPNFLGAITGGITDRQLAAIRAIDGVEVAAPVAIAGELYFLTYQPVDIINDLDSSAISVFRLTQVRTADAGMSTFPASEVTYMIAASNGTVLIHNPGADQTISLTAGGRTLRCDPSVVCIAPHTVCDPPGLGCSGATRSDWTASSVAFGIPMVIAGIDPVAEARLAGLDHCLVDGRYLGSLDTPVVHAASGSRLGSIVLPALLSSRTSLDESVAVKVDRIDDPTLASASSAGLSSLDGWRPIESRQWTAQDFYQTVFDQLHGGLAFSNSYTPGDVRYSSAGSRLTAMTLQPDLSIYSPSQFGESAPPDALDDWFRPVAVRASVDYTKGKGTAPIFNPVGRYNPDCLASFNPLAGGKLETYAPPTVTLPDGRHLGPNASLGGYVNAPPSALTNLASIRALEDPSRYAGSPGDAYISAIRIKVSGVDHPGLEAEHRLTTVAAQIKEETQLQVDIVKGASPRQLQIGLPAGKFGRPALIVTEPWSAKGVAFVFSRAITEQNLALFYLTLLGAAGLVGQSTYTSVKRRRREFGMLRAVGWPRWRIALLVELELLLVAVVAGAIAALAGGPIATRLGFGVSLFQIALAVPVAVGTALVASVVPAILVSRAPVVDVLRRPSKVRKSHRLHGTFQIGVLDLLNEWRWEALIGASAIALGSALIGVVVLIAAGFRGQLDVTVLGGYLSEQVRPFHLALGLVVALIGTITVAQISTLAYLERRRHIAVLRAIGWPTRAVTAMIGAQAATQAAGGCLGALVLVGLAGLGLRASPSALALSLAVVLGSGVVAGALAVLAPLAHALSARPADSLRSE